MSINWFEIIAQIINFFILLFILQKLLYKPVLEAMGKRQESIRKFQVEADEKMKGANELINKYDKKMAEIQKEKQDILGEARKQADEKKERLLEDYQQEALNKRNVYLKEIENEKENFTKNLRKNLGNSAVKIASHILDAISSKELEEVIFDTFILNLESLKGKIPDLNMLKEERVEIISFRDLSEAEKKRIEHVLKDQIKSLKEINYETDSGLVLGYELNIETYTVHANIKNYLNEIEKDIIKNLDID